jgi:hypothetical protein
MLDEDLKPAVRAALRMHEIGSATPYQIMFAGKGASGGSFGFMQGDLAAGPAHVKTTFRALLAAASVPLPKAQAMEALVAVHCVENPLNATDTRTVNAAMASSAGRGLVDGMDETLLGSIYAGLEACQAAADTKGRAIEPQALVYLAMWINMTGAPSMVLNWLSGKPVNLARPAPRLGATVDGPAMEAYLQATSYYVANPRNFPHMVESAAAGMSAMAVH